MKLLDRLFGQVSDLSAARLEVAEARSRLLHTVEEIQSRLAPRNLVGEAVAEAKQRSSAAVDGAAQAIRRRPGIAAMGAAATGFALASLPLLGRFARDHRASDATSAPDRPFTP